MFWGKELCLDFNHGLLVAASRQGAPKGSFGPLRPSSDLWSGDHSDTLPSTMRGKVLVPGRHSAC